MFRCDCYPNHDICKNKNTCVFWIPLNQKLDQVYHQISYELFQLEMLNQRKQDYFKILSEIQQERYTEIVAINGRLKREDYFKILSEIKQGIYTETVNGRQVPKKNVLGEYILEPEHVQVGLNYNVICQDITDTESILRELRRIKHDILKILKKRVDE